MVENLSPKTTSGEFDAISDDMVADLWSVFNLIQDDVLLLVARAGEEGWDTTRLELEVNVLFADLDVEEEDLFKTEVIV